MEEIKKSLDLPEFTSTKNNSLQWRIWHGINYQTGGITFIFGSIMYYPSINAQFNGDLVGGIFFTIGSLAFLLADLTEWNHYKSGCIGPNNKSVNNASHIDNSFKAKFLRAEIGINFFLSTIGSFYYLIGSILFIPIFNALLYGEWAFILGSWIIFLSQSWKVGRSVIPWDWKNVWEDFSGVMVDLFAGLGGFYYALGTQFFKEIITPEDQFKATNWFVSGGTCFTISGLCMMWRYFLSKKDTEGHVMCVKVDINGGNGKINKKVHDETDIEEGEFTKPFIEKY